MNLNIDEEDVEEDVEDDVEEEDFDDDDDSQNEDKDHDQFDNFSDGVNSLKSFSYLCKFIMRSL